MRDGPAGWITDGRRGAPRWPSWTHARQIITAYAAWLVVSPDAALVMAASVLAEQHPTSFWDALIVEAARRAGAGRLLTEDLPGERKLGGV